MKKISFFITQIKQPYHLAQGLVALLLFGIFRKKLRIIGVTGTDGKTTTATMIYHILKTAGKKVALISTVAAFIGDEAIDTGFHVTSPSPFALQRLLRRITNLGYEFVVLEVTSHGIYQHRLFGISPEVAVLTNITHEHLDYHPSYEQYLQTKTSFLARAKISVINKNDKSYKMVHELLRKKDKRVIEYEFRTADPQVRAMLVKTIPEPYNRENALAAITACQQVHIPIDVCLKAIQTFKNIVGRMEEITVPGSDIRVVVDFAHTPNGLQSALSALRASLKKGQQLIAVLGSAGLRDETKRPMMGRIASELADSAVFTAEDPRTEDVNVIIRQMKEGIVKNWGHMHEIIDRREAIVFGVTQLAQKGDVVGIFGKGHERSLNLDGKHEIAWSDQEEAIKALKKRIGK